MRVLLLLAMCLAVATAGMLPYKLIKKYSFGKVMESCFGEEKIEKYLKQYHSAYAKCRGGSAAGHGEEGEEELVEVEEAVEEVDEAVESMLEEETLGNVRRRRSSHSISAEKLDKMKEELHNRLSNWTCTLKHMNLLADDGLMHSEHVKEHIKSMELSSEHLVNDLMEGSDKCYQLSSCMPDSTFEKYPVGVMNGRNMVFSKCFKMVKLEACMKQDFRRKHSAMLKAAEYSDEEAFNLILASTAVKEIMLEA